MSDNVKRSEYDKVRRRLVIMNGGGVGLEKVQFERWVAKDSRSF